MMETERRTHNAERGTGSADASHRRRRRLWFCVLSSALGVPMACSSDKQSTTQPAQPARPSSVSERQDAALRDPFGYKPEFESRDVSGGGLGEFRGDEMKRDIDNVLNP
jgi:hypothetical protein